MAESFLFIDITNNNREAKRLARSHAMKGKNLGRKLIRPSKLGTIRSLAGKQATSQHVTERAITRKDAYDRKDVYNHTNGIAPNALLKSPTPIGYRSFSDDLLSIEFPAEVSLRTQEVIKKFNGVVIEALYPPRLCRSLHKIRSYWLGVLLADQTSYHCAVALMASMDAFFSGRDYLPPKAIYHLNRAVSLVNMRLDTIEALSDSNLAVVTFLVVQHLIREEHVQSRVHIQGLQKMVELRGGLEQLSQNEVLAVKICKTALDYALHYGTTTCFYRDHMADVVQSLEQEGFLVDTTLNRLDWRFDPMDPFLQQILLDVTAICSLFNQHDINFRIESHLLQEIIVSVGHRLVRFHPLSSPPPENTLEAVLHIGLVAFLTTLILSFGRRRYLKFSLVTRCLMDVIDKGLDDRLSDVMLWLLFIGGISVLDGVEQDWFSMRICNIARGLGIDSWSGIHKRIGKLPWIDSIHDEGGRALWDFALKNLERG